MPENNQDLFTSGNILSPRNNQFYDPNLSDGTHKEDLNGDQDADQALQGQLRNKASTAPFPIALLSAAPAMTFALSRLRTSGSFILPHTDPQNKGKDSAVPVPDAPPPSSAPRWDHSVQFIAPEIPSFKGKEPTQYRNDHSSSSSSSSSESDSDIKDLTPSPKYTGERKGAAARRWLKRCHNYFRTKILLTGIKAISAQQVAIAVAWLENSARAAWDATCEAAYADLNANSVSESWEEFTEWLLPRYDELNADGRLHRQFMNIHQTGDVQAYWSLFHSAYKLHLESLNQSKTLLSGLNGQNKKGVNQSQGKSKPAKASGSSLNAWKRKEPVSVEALAEILEKASVDENWSDLLNLLDPEGLDAERFAPLIAHDAQPAFLSLIEDSSAVDRRYLREDRLNTVGLRLLLFCACLGQKRTYDGKALLVCSATGNFVDEKVLEFFHNMLYATGRAKFPVQLGTFRFDINALIVLNLGYDVILGCPWFVKSMPEIDWRTEDVFLVAPSTHRRHTLHTVPPGAPEIALSTIAGIELIFPAQVDRDMKSKDAQSCLFVICSASDKKASKDLSVPAKAVHHNDPRIKAILEKHKDLFRKELEPDLPPKRSIVHEIDIGDSKPVNVNAYPLSVTHMDKLKRQLTSFSKLVSFALRQLLGLPCPLRQKIQ
ncbi:hypothetical protein KEM56_006557 [Ascosphaera pollenicola]|nr:hypothetical protein KEM56_006557 [Ascosphaera pollenicola]